LMGKGAFPEDHSLALGMTGIWGTRPANETTKEADVILAVGTGFAEADCSSWVPDYTFAIPPDRLIQIDADPQEIGKIYPVEVGLLGDGRATLRALLTHMIAEGSVKGPCPCRIPDLDKKKQNWREELSATQKDSGKPIHPAR